MRYLALAAALVFAATPVRADEQSRTTPAFTSIELRGPISIDVQAGKAQGITVRGTPKFVGMVVTEVVGGELRIHLRDTGIKKMDGDPRVIITVPQLRKFTMEGAGETILRDISGERLDVSYRGAGSMVIAGKVGQLNLAAQGVGDVDTRRLLAQDADVNFKGIGSVRVYASNKLEANVQGMGELSYYGHPKSVSKSVSGIGSISAGD